MALLNNAILTAYTKLCSMRLWDEDGQGMAEYALILALVAVVVAVTFTALAGGIKNTLTTVTHAL